MRNTINQYSFRVGLFLLIVFIVVVLLYPVLQNAFLSNIFINIIILTSLVVGIIYNVLRLIDLNKDYNALTNFNINGSPKSFVNSTGLLKNISNELRELNGRFVFKSSSVKSSIENIDMSLSSIRETSRYLVGLLVFLGLLGTFWGLLKTIGSVGNVISGLGIDDTNVAGFFNSLKDGLNAPLQGMSIAFSSSLLGLAGSLILGFIDLNLGQAQIKFSQYFEKVLNNNMAIDVKNNASKLDEITSESLQKIFDNLDNAVLSLKETNKNQNSVSENLKELNNQLKQIQKQSLIMDKQLSNFLSTQLNTQSSILQLMNQLNDNGIIDEKTKKYLNNIDKGIQNLNLLNKKNK